MGVKKRTIKGRFSKGLIVLLEPLELEEGKEVLVSIPGSANKKRKNDPTLATAGAWTDLLDCDSLEKEIYASRLIQSGGGGDR
jgi:hypothetical protein